MKLLRSAALCVFAATAGLAAAQTAVPEPTELVEAQHCMFCH
ncbi:cytochrome C, partial [Paraburkholderia sp. SIMBA_009]